MRGLLGKEAGAFFEAMGLEPVVSVRLNSRKPTSAFAGERVVPWCPTGRYLESRPVFTLDPLLHAGAYYVQDASSMIYNEVIRRLLPVFQEVAAGPGMGLAVLDMCAAPGGKTTAMIDALPDGTRVVANEYVARRAAILGENLAKWGYPDVTVTNRDTAFYGAGGEAFDIVAVDAPCSGEGMMRKDAGAVAQWTPKLVDECAALQRRILQDAVKTLRPGGFLIYSTCTFNRTENEENVQYAVDEFGMIPHDLDLPPEWGIGRGIVTDLPVYRFMPHITEGEGLFLAVLRKPGEFEPRAKILPDKATKLSSPAKNKKDKGFKAKSEDVPAVEEVLSCNFDRTRFPEAGLNLEQALAYLRRESVVLDGNVPKGLVVMTYAGLPLGMAKNIGTRANNLYPKNWRILMR